MYCVPITQVLGLLMEKSESWVHSVWRMRLRLFIMLKTVSLILYSHMIQCTWPLLWDISTHTYTSQIHIHSYSRLIVVTISTRIWTEQSLFLYTHHLLMDKRLGNFLLDTEHITSIYKVHYIHKTHYNIYIYIYVFVYIQNQKSTETILDGIKSSST